MEFGSSKNVLDKKYSSSKREGPGDDQLYKAPAPPNAFAEVNMEVAVTVDEVMRAGGFGATDDINSILPVASNFTDFENHLREDWGCEESKYKIVEGQSDPPKTILQVGKDDVEEHMAPDSQEAFEAVNMEASVTSDEVIRAGGFGATDNMSSFLPVASDFTDFEANLRDARDYEDLDEKISRPGLGWTSETK